MRINKLIENDVIMPGEPSPADELEAAEDRRSDEIRAMEQKLAQAYFRAYAKAGINLFDDDGIPVYVNFDEEEQKVEIYVTIDDSFSVQSLIKLSEAGLIDPGTMIGASHKDGVVIERELPAADTPFRKFLNLTVPGTGSGGAASNSSPGSG